MKKLFLFLIVSVAVVSTSAQQNKYWQQEVNYHIDVALDTAQKALTGKISFRYFNHSPDTLHYIWMHLWPNAYKNDQTAFSEQLIINQRTDFYFSGAEQKGYINQLDFLVNGIHVKTTDHPQHQDILKLILPTLLLPNDSIDIETPFHVKLPSNFSRGGFIGDSYQITQWYPKPAVYDHKGWHPIPYLDQGEFYSEFGRFDVNITVPDSFVVAATGKLITETHSNHFKHLTYSQDRIHDFAWFADKNFSTEHDTLNLNGRIIDLYAYHHASRLYQKGNVLQMMKHSIRSKSTWLGEYPYDIVSVVESNKSGGGGMEYPTITLIDPTYSQRSLYTVINHEIGHNWFYGILASNERAHPWMDEGMNTYYDHRFEKEYIDTITKKKWGNNTFFDKRIPADQELAVLKFITAAKRDQPMDLNADAYSELNYGLIVYEKSARWMESLEQQLGRNVFDSLMKNYYHQWQFKHPDPEDFKAIFLNYDSSLMTHFNLLHQTGPLTIDTPSKRNWKLLGWGSFVEPPKNNYLFVAPAIGYNHYDQLMAGFILHNYTLPSYKFNFIATPMLGTGTKNINGLGIFKYQFRAGRNGNRFHVKLHSSTFTNNRYTDSAGIKHHLRFSKLAPEVCYQFYSRDSRSSFRGQISWKTFFISETNIQFNRDTVLQKDILSFPRTRQSIHQLELMLMNNRKLYPFETHLRLEKGPDYMKAGLEGTCFFNYAKGGGLQTRFFAGKFFYLNPATLSATYKTERYHLNLSGSNGYEDYTYSNYFPGRSEFEGWKSQQIMIRDGGFKVRSELLSSKIGKTDNWLIAMNFNSSIPKNINPFELLPIKLPVQVFADIGTTADCWKQNAEQEKLYYDAGLELSFLAKTVHIYFPLLYSRSFNEYYKSVFPEKRFLKKISFSIDLQNIRLQKIFPQYPL